MQGQNQSNQSQVSKSVFNQPLTHQDFRLSKQYIKDCINHDGTMIVAYEPENSKALLLSSIIRYILENKTVIQGRIITYENSINEAYDAIKSEHSVVEKKSDEVNDNRSAMLRAPSAIMLGDLRNDTEIESSIELSLSGFPVFASINAPSVSKILPCLLDQFPKSLHVQKTFALIESVGVLAAQKTITLSDGKQVMILEKLKVTKQLREHLLQILEHSKEKLSVADRISEIMREGTYESINYETQLKELLDSKLIDETAYQSICAQNSIESTYHGK